MAGLAEYQRFILNEPESWVEYRTLEIYHPAFSQVYRYVNGYADKDFTLESGAPRNPGALVTFTAAGFQVTEPVEREDNDQVLDVTFSNVDATVHNILDQISGADYFDQIEVVYRKYYSGDTSEPAVSPLYLNASAVTFTSSRAAAFTAEDTDLGTKRVGILYTTELFPGLAID